MGVGTRPGGGRIKGFLSRRLRDAVLVLAWLVVMFNLVQLSRQDDLSGTRLAVSCAAMVAVGLAATGLWWWDRRRGR
ncbi:MAG: hypothetical protein WKF79_13000 [Nocardioides sp.]